MNTGVCGSINTQEYTVTLTPTRPHAYFCIDQAGSFSLNNLNWPTYPGSGVYINVGCSSTGNPTGALGLFLPDGNSRYFQSDSSCDLEACDY